MTGAGGLRLTVIGSSGSFPGPGSAASCYLLQAEERGRTWRVLLDLGNGALGPLQAYTALHDVDAVLLSHLHPDHCLDLCGMYVALRYHPTRTRPQRLPVWGPPGTLPRLVRAYGADDPADAPPEHVSVPAAMDAVFDVASWADGETVDVGPLRITARRVRHPVPTFGFRIEVAGRVVVYSGDTDDCAALRDLAAGADLFLCEASFVETRDTARGVHLTGRRAGEVAAACDVRHLVLTHIPPWTDAHDVVEEARTVWPGPLDVAVPGGAWVAVDGSATWRSSPLAVEVPTPRP